jgi:hypothetical protein
LYNTLIEIFLKKQFRKPGGTFWVNKNGEEYPKIQNELFNNDKYTGISITNDNKKIIRLDELAFNVYIKKGFFSIEKIFEVKNGPFENGFPILIQCNESAQINIPTNFDVFKKETLIYEVIASINGIKIINIKKVLI